MGRILSVHDTITTHYRQQKQQQRRKQFFRSCGIFLAFFLIYYCGGTNFLPSSSYSLSTFNADLLTSSYAKLPFKSPPKPLSVAQTKQPQLFVHIGKAGGTSILLMVQKSTAKCQELKESERGRNKKKSKQQEDRQHHNTDGDGGDEDDDLDAVQAQTCAIARIPTARVHLKSGQDKYAQYSQFLVNVRNPIDRIISWYNYELHSFEKEPRWQEGGEASTNFRHLKQCYPRGIGQVVEQGLVSNNKDDTTTEEAKANKLSFDDCRELAKKCLRGDIMCFGHNYYNYEVYGEDLLHWRKSQKKRRDIRIDVIRSEYSIYDFDRIVNLWTKPVVPANKAYQLTSFVRSLYGRVRTIEDYQVKNLQNAGQQIKSVQPTNKYVSQEAVTALCRWICVELVTYKHLLLEADNLSAQDVQDSYQELDDRCQLNVDQECGTVWEYRNIKRQKNVYDMPW